MRANELVLELEHRINEKRLMVVHSACVREGKGGSNCCLQLSKKG